MLLQDRQYLLGDSPGDVELVIPAFEVEIAAGRLGDGPASDRVVVVDVGGGGRDARPPAKLLPPKGARGVRSFAFDEEILDPYREDAARFEDDTFVRLHCFACVHATLEFFEQLLGRRVAWSFDADRLEVVPWAGVDRKASYDRASGSIKLFTYDNAEGRRILTALSRDIVAHEAAHAILDAVVPDLNDAADPDSLTIHEAVGDFSALLQTLVDEKILFSIENISGGGGDPLEKLGRMAEEFGVDVRRGEGAAALRSASNDATFRTGDGHGPTVDRSDPHAASAVVVGALFAVLRERTESSTRGFERAVATAGRELARIVVPALNRLPPGEVSLRDFARALDSAARETATGPAWMKAFNRQLVDRGVADDPSSLRAPEPSSEPLVGWPAGAAELVEANRERLGVPPGVSPEVVSAEFDDRTWTKTPKPRLQLRAAWELYENHDVGFWDSWAFRVGTTAVVDAETGIPVSILTGSAVAGEGSDRRDQQLRRWDAGGVLVALAHPADGPLGVAGDRPQRVVGTARTLHLLQPDPPKPKKTKRGRSVR
jgi:hypothetical protein